MAQPGKVRTQPTDVPPAVSGGSRKAPGVAGSLRRAVDPAYDGSGNDAEASCDTQGDDHVLVRARSRRELAAGARDNRRRRSSGRRPGPVIQMSPWRGELPEYALDDGEALEPPRGRRTRAAPPKEETSLLRAFSEALFFLGIAGAVVYKMYAEDDAALRRKLPEVLVVVLLGFVCFFSHLNATCTVWATRVRYLRKTDMADALYSILLMPLLACMYLVDGLPHDPPRPLSPPRFGLDSRRHWRATLLPLSGVPQTAEQMLRARSAMLDTQVLYAVIIGTHILATTWHRKQSKRRGQHLQIENMPAATVFVYYVAFAVGVTAFVAMVKTALYVAGLSGALFGDLTITQVVVNALIFQVCLYAWTRVARQNFTLGELSMACMFNTTMVVESVYLTLYKLAPEGRPFVSFRTPTSLLAYQQALMVGMMFIGIVLSPLLALSRVLAQRPTHRLRWPDKRNLHRRLLALAFFLFMALLVFGTLGPWVWWMLGGRNPWLFMVRFTLQGPFWWSRLALLGYWGMLCNIALLSIQLMVNRVWQYATVGDQVQAHALKRRAARSESLGNPPRTTRTASERAGSLAASRFAQPHAEGEETSLGPALAVNVNGRRKFFHMLAVLLFIPGIAWDVRIDAHPACVCTPCLQRGVCAVCLWRVPAVLRRVPRGREPALFPEPVSGLEGLGTGHPEPHVPALGLCGGRLARDALGGAAAARAARARHRRLVCVARGAQVRAPALAALVQDRGGDAGVPRERRPLGVRTAHAAHGRGLQRVEPDADLDAPRDRRGHLGAERQPRAARDGAAARLAVARVVAARYSANS